MAAANVRDLCDRFFLKRAGTLATVGSTEPREETIRFSQWKNFLWSFASAALGLAIIMGTIRAYLHSAGRPSSIDVLIGLAICATASVIFLRKALDRSPQIIIFKGGVSLQRVTLSHIPWSKIKSCRSVGSKGHSSLLLLLDGEFQTPNPTPLLLRPLFALEKRLVGPSFGIPTSGYDMSHSMIRTRIEEWIAYKRYNC